MGRRVLFDALAARYGGGAYAAIQLARKLAATPDVAELVVVARRGSIVQRGLVGDEAVRCIVVNAAPRMELIRRIAWQVGRLPSLVRRERCDVVLTMSWLPRRPPGARVVCLLGNPVMYETSTGANLLRRWAVRRTAREATYLAAPSGLMAGLVSSSVGRPCAVLPWGVDHGVFSPATTAGSEILCVGDFYAHKRHDLLIDAWLLLRAPRPVLRLVGNPDVDPEAHGRLITRIAKLSQAGSIELEYRVSRERLVRAYRGARVFVVASEHESFCMPLAESMACGVPAVVRAIDSLRETASAGARYVDSDDPARWAAAIEALIDDDAEHDRARKLAIDAAARFSWERCAATLAAQL
ncbi:MAG TPA: glycosyltransferase family 1 protein [Solirubrobacteraceae bacterium]|nr:glycosyltransferase family 1 protein [Solirubrobacteraceae bacterium]